MTEDLVSGGDDQEAGPGGRGHFRWWIPIAVTVITAAGGIAVAVINRDGGKGESASPSASALATPGRGGTGSATTSPKGSEAREETPRSGAQPCPEGKLCLYRESGMQSRETNSSDTWCPRVKGSDKFDLAGHWMHDSLSSYINDTSRTYYVYSEDLKLLEVIGPHTRDSDTGSFGQGIERYVTTCRLN
ncbi:peptidase inhibitor family I36 protein [Streptomyces sp. NPDC050844]|uniref:peptidase inhibitor family I36 protein n=1 Tax=Streptomyces sp. NPDC050844 TaxID=3155790 RepID=UPI0033D04D3B